MTLDQQYDELLLRMPATPGGPRWQKLILEIEAVEAKIRERNDMRQPRIINVRGTSGAGKTHLMRGMMDLYRNREPVTIAGRKMPLGYKLWGREEEPPLFVPGHYESPCGGCDTISKYIPGVLPVEPAVEKPNSYDLSFGLVEHYFAQGYDVLFEGLLISGDAARCTKLHAKGLPLTIVCINIPVDECIASVQSRRAAAGNDKPLNEVNTREKHRLMQTCIKKLRTAGIDVRDCPTRELAAATVANLLNVEGARGEPGQAEFVRPEPEFAKHVAAVSATAAV